MLIFFILAFVAETVNLYETNAIEWNLLQAKKAKKVKFFEWNVSMAIVDIKEKSCTKRKMKTKAKIHNED